MRQSLWGMSELSVTIRPETPDDAEAIERLHERTFGPGRYAKTAYRIREGGPPERRALLLARRAEIFGNRGHESERAFLINFRIKRVPRTQLELPPHALWARVAVPGRLAPSFLLCRPGQIPSSVPSAVGKIK